MDVDQEIEEGKLLEALTLERNFVEPKTPLFTCFCYRSAPDWWNWYGGPWPVRADQNPKNYYDLIYTNQEGKKHRVYGPAYISRLYKLEAWYKDGLLHRENGPAYSHGGNFAWFYEGKLHNLNGPAVDERAGPKQYWIHGVRYSKKQYKWEIERRRRKGKLYNEFTGKRSIKKSD